MAASAVDAYEQVQKGSLKVKGVAELGVTKRKKKKDKDKAKMLETTGMTSEKSAEEERRCLDKRTPAQAAFEKMQEKRQMERILKKASKTHKQRVEDFNRHLDTLTEHYDIPKLFTMANEEMNEDYPVEIHDSLTALESSLGAVDDMLKTMMSVSRNELLQKLDPLEQAKVDLVSAYTLNSMFWVYLATQGVNPKEHPVKQELERIRVYMNRVKEITDKKKAAKLDRGAASRFVKNALWEPKPKNTPRVANKGKSKH
ncbi:Nuclear nucleic acid-binding protein C1D [Apodemus speciosus]|uniref:Nuclear nucleic acid-binding protein C1D n=1 Tax=Apodemus speciosus TaxID=105296 RepID=A0ABQ0F983_APOSI